VRGGVRVRGVMEGGFGDTEIQREKERVIPGSGGVGG